MDIQKTFEINSKIGRAINRKMTDLGEIQDYDDALGVLHMLHSIICDIELTNEQSTYIRDYLQLLIASMKM